MPTCRSIPDLLQVQKRNHLPAARREEIATTKLEELVPADILEAIYPVLEDMDCEGDQADRFIREVVLESELLRSNPDVSPPNTDEKINLLRRIQSLSTELAELLSWENENRWLELHGSLQQYVNPDAGPSEARYLDAPGDFDGRAVPIAIEGQQRLQEDLEVLGRACEFARGWQDEVLRPIFRGLRLGPYQGIALFLWEQCRSYGIVPHAPSSPRGELAELFNLTCRLSGIPEKPNPVYYLDQWKGSYMTAFEQSK